MESEPAREAEEEEIDVIWDENGAARYRILKDTRIVDFDGHNIAWLDEHGNIIDYEGRHRGFYANGVFEILKEWWWAWDRTPRDHIQSSTTRVSFQEQRKPLQLQRRPSPRSS